MENNELSKCKSLGKLIGFFFNIIGLFAAFLYPQDSEERKNFISGWRIGFETFLLIFILAIVVYFIISFLLILWTQGKLN